jgi:hypothetical protein
MQSISENAQLCATSSNKIVHDGCEGEAVAPGFIYSSTSLPDTQNNIPFTLDRRVIRLKGMKKGVINGARLHEQDLKSLNQRFHCVFVTLTYRDGVAWEPKHISSCLYLMRLWCKSMHVKFRYVWVAEIQEKRKRKFGDGAGHCVHYHIMIWLPKALQLPKPDKRGWWPHGMSKTEKARNPIGYIAKYASKGTKFDFPPGCRLHGCGGLSLISRLERTWWSLPSCIRGMYPDKTDKVRRAKGGGWFVHSTGEWFASLFKIISFFPLTVVRI